jgi:cation diffusion facilitator family transporter
MKPTDNIKVQQYILVLAVVLFVAKLAAYFLTHSIAVLTDALESTVNVITGFTGLYTLYVSARPRDENHPYGHGKVELISASFEGALIIMAGMMIVYVCINGLLHPQPVQQLDYGIIILSASALANFLIGAWSIRTGSKNHSLALIASGKHLQSDTWTTVGIVLGLFAVKLTGIARLDSLIALFFAFYILYEGVKILRQSISGIMDEADAGLLVELILMLNQRRNNNWIDLHNLRIIKYGAILHLDCHITLPWYYNIREAHREIDALEASVREQFPQSIELFVHTDDCRPPQACAICPVANCPERQTAFKERLPWTFENITSNQRHSLARREDVALD